MTPQQQKTIGISKSISLEIAANIITYLPDNKDKLNHFTSKSYNWIISHSDTTQNNIVAQSCVKYAIRGIAVFEIINMSMERIIEVAELYYNWILERTKDRDSNISAQSAINRTLSFVELDILDFDTQELMLEKADNIYKWIIKG